MSGDRTLLVGSFSALAAAALFGTLGPLSRVVAEQGVDGVAFTAWRGILGVAFVGVLIVSHGGVRPSLDALAALDGRGRASLAIAASTALAVNVAMFSAFGLIPIALALMLFYTYPAGVAVIDVLLGHERFTPPRLLALALSISGVVLVLAGGIDGTAGVTVDALGVVLALGAAMSQIVFVTVSRTGYRSVPADSATLLFLAVVAAGASVVTVVIGQSSSLTAPFDNAAAWPPLLAGGVLAGGVSSVLFLRAIRFIGGTRTGILMLFEPVVGVTLAAIWLGETLVPIQLVGGGLVLAGAAVLQLRSAPDHETIVEAGASPVM